MNRKNYKSDEAGVIFIEFAMAFTLLLVIVLGMAQQYIYSLNRLTHYALATEVLMGPQEKSMVFDPATGVFSALSSLTTPTSSQYLDTIGNFLFSRFPNSDYSAYIKLGYLTVNPNTGELLSINNSILAEEYVGSTAQGCEPLTTGKVYATRFLNSRFNLMQANLAATPPANEDDDTGRIGIKIYDFKLGTTRYRQYADLMPFVFIYMCSSPVNIAFSKPVHTYHLIVPRRLTN